MDQLINTFRTFAESVYYVGECHHDGCNRNGNSGQRELEKIAVSIGYFHLMIVKFWIDLK